MKEKKNRHLFRFVLTLALSTLGSSAFALPQFSVESSRQCDNCHLDPSNWSNPELKDRKCTLSCNGCHVNPTGGGMRNASGGFYGREILPMFGERPSESTYRAAPGGQPASQPTSQLNSNSSPRIGWVSKVGLAELPALALIGAKAETYYDAGPGTPSRFAGMNPFPRFQVGTDVRLMVYRDQSQNKTSVFPMQMDLHLAATPIKVTKYNEGRLTLLTTVGVEGSRAQGTSDMLSRLFAKEYFALYDNLPYNMYAKAGRFLPAFGWRLDDHTSLVRQNFTFDNEGQRSGVEIGINPNYAFAHASFFNNSQKWDKPFDAEAGYGTAIHMGYRELLWQAGASFMYETSDVSSGTWAGLNWSFNMHDATPNHPWKGFDWLPLIYLGELDYRRVEPVGGGRSVNSLAAFHELNYLVVQGINLKTRYDWRDIDLELLNDHQHRYTFGVDYHPYTFVEINAQIRLNRFGSGDSATEGLLIVHGWY